MEIKMNQTINRQQFLSGDLKGTRSPARPPWSIIEEAFIEQCTGCGACWQQCPENILTKGRGNYPVINLNQRECTLCHRCADVCTRDAIYYSKKLSPWLVGLHIDTSCLAKQGVVCVTCAEQCDTQAITLIPQLGNVTQPKIDESRCNGCGACEAPCPAHAIHITRNQFFTFTPSTQEVMV